jgi:hypothetical protein
MTLATLAKYLFLLDRQAIRDIAGCQQAVWLGLLFVLSAGFAREYDGEDLLAEPWHLLIPLGASLATSFLLFGLVWLLDRGWKREELPFREGYRSFLGLYWMTAPLAWLYAIPVERFLSPAEAVRANLWLLAIVAAWRVILMVRVVAILLRVSVGRALFPVLLFADSLVVVILFLTPLPVFSIMGGIRLSESEQIIQATAFFVGAIGILSWPIWLIGSVVMAAKALPPQSSVATSSMDRKTMSLPMWGLGVVSLTVWLFILPVTQPEQQRRRRVEVLLREGHIEQAIEVMSAHERSDFPPHWDPPPRIGYGETTPELPKVLETLIVVEAKPWVAELYWEKFRDLIGHGYDFHNYWLYLDDAEFDRHLAILEHLPENSPILAEQREHLESLLSTDSSNASLMNAQKDRLRKLLGEAKDDGLQRRRHDQGTEGMDETLESTP